MLYINETRITIDEIIAYRGGDPVMLQLQNGYNELNEKFFSRGLSVQFKLGAKYVKKHKGGHTEYKGGIVIPFAENIETAKGGSVVRYCEDSFVKDNNRVFRPKSEWFYKQVTFIEKQVEKALFYYAVSPITMSGRKIVLVDVEKTATEKAQTRGKESALTFYLYNENSPIYDDRDKLIDLAYIFGVSKAADKSDNVLKNAIHDIIKGGKKVKEFADAVKESSPFYSALIAVQKGLDEEVLIYEKNKWYFKTASGKESICKVGIGETETKKDVLATKLLINPEIYNMLRAVIGQEQVTAEEVKEPTKFKVTEIPPDPKKMGRPFLSPELTLEIMASMDFSKEKRNVMLKAASLAKLGSVFKCKNPELLSKLKEWQEQFKD